MSSTRDQWKIIISNSLRKKIDVLMKSEKFQKFLSASRTSMLAEDDMLLKYNEYLRIGEELDKACKYVEELNKKSSEISRELYKKYPKGSENRFGVQANIETAALDRIINGPVYQDHPDCAEIVKISKAFKTLDYQFLLATTPAKLQATVDNIISSLGLKIEEL